MPTLDLIVTADYPNRTAEFTLQDANGVHLGYRQTDFKTLPYSRWQSLFDLRNYLEKYVDPDGEAAAVAEVGVSIAEEVLGEDMFRKLWASGGERTLRIRLPGAAEESNPLAEALARVPWEIARPSADKLTLSERNLVVQVVNDFDVPPNEALELRPDESLRVLFVFAAARGSQPLAARRERRELLRLFQTKIYPNCRIEADFLSFGVTRERLSSQIQERNGYHIVHWSGHGHRNLLELAHADGTPDRLSGDELLGLFETAGGFIPRLFFLSACHSGDVLNVKDWKEFLAASKGTPKKGATSIEPLEKDLVVDDPPGYTGTAHALLRGGVRALI
jgi:hypothetical protein